MARAEKIASVVLVLTGLCVSFYAREVLKLGPAIAPGAGFLPFLIGIALGVLGVVWFIQLRFAGTARQAEDGGDAAEPAGLRRANILRRLVPGLVLVLFYAWLLERTGYLLATALFMVGWQKTVEKESWIKAAIVALLAAGLLYGLFARLLNVFLPSGIWFD